MNKIIKYWKSIIWIIIIFILSAISGDELNKVPKIPIPHFDKIAHFGMYFILTSILILDFSASVIGTKNTKLNIKIMFYVLIFSLSYGILMELMQEFVFEKRSASFYDFLANALGSFIAMFGKKYWLNFISKVH